MIIMLYKSPEWNKYPLHEWGEPILVETETNTVVEEDWHKVLAWYEKEMEQNI